MTAQILDRVLTVYRIGDPAGRYPIFDATGSRLFPGRWNAPGSPAIYASEHYSTAMLEKLVHGSGSLPPNQHFIEITIPNGITYEMFDEAAVPDWADPSCIPAKLFGARWCGEIRSAILIVPSVVARMEKNILINPAHPDFSKISFGLHRPVWWDRRLFS